MKAKRKSSANDAIERDDLSLSARVLEGWEVSEGRVEILDSLERGGFCSGSFVTCVP